MFTNVIHDYMSDLNNQPIIDEKNFFKFAISFLYVHV